MYQTDDTRMRTGVLRIFCTCLLLLTFFSLPVMAAEEATGKEHAKTLVLIYMVGSDLESGLNIESGNDGTNDILDMVNGYGNTSPEDLNIVVGYGGSKKDGWEGLSIASIEDLIKDSADGVIGNEGINEFNNPDTNMGDKTGLSTFLSYIKNKYDGDKVYLIFWDHGDGFDGFGWDENTGDNLSIKDIESVLSESGSRYDLIGFDACLMAGLEVAKALSPYAKYMVASEEISTGGWKYDDWVSNLAKNPNQDPASIGRIIVDSFFNKDEPSGNTASLIDLSRVKKIEDSLDKLGTTLSENLGEDSSIIPIARAYEKTTRFGEDPSDEDQVALKLDLGTLVNYLSESVNEAKSPVVDLKSALNDAVIHEKHDDLMINATGLSIADPLTVPDSKYTEIADLLSISPGWDSFVQKVREDLKDEIPTPDIVSVGTNTYSLKNPDESADISIAYFAVDNKTGDLLQLGSLPAESIDDGKYELPEWDGEWYYIQDSEKPDQNTLIDFDYGDTTATGISKYISEVNLVRNGTMHNTIMYSYVDPDTNWTKYSLRPYDTDKDGQTFFSRSGFTPKAGDSFISFASVYSPNGTDLGTRELGRMKLSGTPEIVSGILPDGLYGRTIMANSVTDKSDIGDMHLINIKDGVVTQGDIIREN